MRKLSTDPFPERLPAQKASGYGPSEYYGRRSTAPTPTKAEWGKGSYRKDGRGVCFGDPPGYDTMSKHKVKFRDTGEE